MKKVIIDEKANLSRRLTSASELDNICKNLVNFKLWSSVNNNLGVMLVINDQYYVDDQDSLEYVILCWVNFKHGNHQLFTDMWNKYFKD